MIETALEEEARTRGEGSFQRIDKSQLPSAKQQIQTQSTFICEENNKTHGRNNKVKADLEHISLLIELEKDLCEFGPQRQQWRDVIDMLMNTMRGMRGSLTLRALTERSLKKEKNKRQSCQLDTIVRRLSKELKRKNAGLTKKGTKEAEQYAKIP
ncbi:Hypothetical_protein [Hexamita inflata]|uniref:Hypothetical_protein n=1 Tax=Hexamita inflata TaxID=28002 RepID=A0AA86VMS7_9EUKA|nr:Hypothetical protein HINF_LOCUS58638 [Hexamita inflata]